MRWKTFVAGATAVLGLAGSASAASVFFTRFLVNDCNEIGVCDWKLSCALGPNQVEQVFFSMREANTGEQIEINRTLNFEKLPVTVHCTVQEHDGGIGAEWEDVGSEQMTVLETGQYRIGMANDEGDVDVLFTVDNVGQAGSALTVERSRDYTGVFRAGQDAHYLWVGADWPSFSAKWKALSEQKLRLIDLDTYVDGGRRRYVGVFRAGNDGHYLWSGVDWPSFEAKWQELSKQGLRLVDVETYVEGSTRRYAGVFRAGDDGHALWVGANWADFVAKWKELSKQGLRLIDVETYREGNARKFIGVFRAGNGGYYLFGGLEWPALTAKWTELSKNGMRLIDLERYPDGNKQRYLAVFRAGTDGYALYAAKGPKFLDKWKELSKQGLRLVDLEVSPE